MEREGAKDLLRMRLEEDSRKSSCFLKNFLQRNRDSVNKEFTKRKMYIETAGLSTVESVRMFKVEKADMLIDVDVNSELVVGAMLPMSRSGGKLNLENRTQTIGSPAKKMRLCHGSNFDISLGFWSNLDDGGNSTALCSDNKSGGKHKKNGKWN